MSHEHRGGILDIICTAVEQRVKSKDRTLLKYAAMRVPTYFPAAEITYLLERIHSHGNGSRLFKSRKSDKSIFMPYRLFKISSEVRIHHFVPKPSGYIDGSKPSGILPSDTATSESTTLSSASLSLEPRSVFIMKFRSASTAI